MQEVHVQNELSPFELRWYAVRSVLVVASVFDLMFVTNRVISFLILTCSTAAVIYEVMRKCGTIENN
jgi:hypothetical protein